VGHSPDQVRDMRERLADRKRRGLAVIDDG